MSTLALLLQDPAASQVRSWWECLEQRLGLKGVHRVPFPHVSLFGFDGIDHPRVQRVLEDYADHTAPVRIKAVGLGLFLRPAPVVYCPVIRTPELSALHGELWEAVGNLGGHRYRLYAPEHWIPHLTLAQFDLNPAQALAALELLWDMDIEVEVSARNLTLFDFIGPLYEPRERYALRGRAPVPA